MSSVKSRRPSALVRRLLLLAALAAPGAGFSQDPLVTEQTAQQRELLEHIREESARGGVNSADLIEPLTALGLSYQEQGEHNLAAAAFHNARQVVRVNLGFSSLEEAQLLRHLVRAEEARGNAEQAWYLEQELLALAMQHRGELETFGIFREMGEKRMNTLARYEAGEAPPEIVLGCYYARTYLKYGRRAGAFSPQQEDCYSGSRRVVVMALVTEARAYQGLAVEALLRNGRYTADELYDLVASVIRSNYVYGDPSAGSFLRQVLAHLPENGETLLVRTNVLIQVADLDVVRSHRERRFSDAVPRQYEAAFESLDRAGVDPALIEEIFSPEMPVVLPAFRQNPLDSSGVSASSAYIDVAFDVTKHGTSDRIEILDATPGVARAAQRHLVRLIKHSSFRPRIEDGRVADASRVVVRYRVPTSGTDEPPA